MELYRDPEEDDDNGQGEIPPEEDPGEDPPP